MFSLFKSQPTQQDLQARAKEAYEKVVGMTADTMEARSKRRGMALLCCAHLDKTFIAGAERTADWNPVRVSIRPSIGRFMLSPSWHCALAALQRLPGAEDAAHRRAGRAPRAAAAHRGAPPLHSLHTLAVVQHSQPSHHTIPPSPQPPPPRQVREGGG